MQITSDCFYFTLSLTIHVPTALSDLNNVILALADHAKHFVIAGVNLLTDSAIKAQSLSLLEDFHLLSEPTRVTNNNSTLIDHIITTKQTPKLRMVQTCGLSDHHVQEANFDHSLTLKLHQEYVKFVHLGSVIEIAFVKLYVLLLGMSCLYLMTSMTSGVSFIIFSMNVLTLLSHLRQT